MSPSCNPASSSLCHYSATIQIRHVIFYCQWLIHEAIFKAINSDLSWEWGANNKGRHRTLKKKPTNVVRQLNFTGIRSVTTTVALYLYIRYLMFVRIKNFVLNREAVISSRNNKAMQLYNTEFYLNSFLKNGDSFQIYKWYCTLQTITPCMLTALNTVTVHKPAQIRHFWRKGQEMTHWYKPKVKRIICSHRTIIWT